MSYVARLLSVAHRMANLSPGTNEWHSAIAAAGREQVFYEKYDDANAETVTQYLALDEGSSSSIAFCIEAARQNARAVRASLTNDVWDAINGTWHEARNMTPGAIEASSLSATLDWVTTRATLFEGAYRSTMLRNDAYSFAALGTAIERADNTARILDVKYHILLPKADMIGGSLDHYQWTAILQAVSARRNYHWFYKDAVSPWNVAELLILRPQMPRSMRSSFDEIVRHLDLLADHYGGRAGECHRIAGQMRAGLKYQRIETVLEEGLHEFLTGYIDQTIELGDEIAYFYLM